MLQVFICDDDDKQRKRFGRTISNYITIEDLDVKVAISSHSPNDIVSFLEKNDIDSGLYFLDMDLNCETDGIALAEQIRKYDPRGFIVFITAFADTLPLTFKHKVEALDFITKDDLKINDRICECIRDAYIKHTGKNTELQDNFVFRSNNNIISLNRRKILYFESSQDMAHKVIVYADNGTYTFYGKMNELENSMGSDFFRCHKSFIVNIRRIKGIDTAKKIISLDYDAACYVSARNIKKLVSML